MVRLRKPDSALLQSLTFLICKMGTIIVKEFRTLHSKICCFGILIILSKKHLNNSRCGKGIVTYLFLPESRRWTPTWKILSLYQEERIFLSPEIESQGQEKNACMLYSCHPVLRQSLPEALIGYRRNFTTPALQSGCRDERLHLKLIQYYIYVDCIS